MGPYLDWSEVFERGDRYATYKLCMGWGSSRVKLDRGKRFRPSTFIALD